MSANAVTGQQPVEPGPGGAAPAAGSGAASALQIFLLGCGLICLALLIAYLFVCVWPSTFTQDTKGVDETTVSFLLTTVSFKVSADVRLLLMVMLAGGLGSFIHTATSFGDFVGNQKLSRSWLWWYILKPFIGMALAVVFYLVIRGGFLSAGAEAGKLNVYGIAALAGLAGMFSKQATDKLSEVFDAMFRTAAANGDAKRKDDLGNPTPVLIELGTTSIALATQNSLVNLKGSSFVRDSLARVNGRNRETAFVDAGQLTVKLLPEDVASAGQLEVVVFNPPPGGGISAPLEIKVVPSAGEPGAATGDTALSEAHVDGCDVEILAATPDEALPAAQGGVTQS